VAFSQRGLSVYTAALDFDTDGAALLPAADLAALPCDTSRARRLPAGQVAAAQAAQAALAVAWQPGQLALFNAELLTRFLAGGRGCTAP
jgi:hypothetical protein